MKTSNRPLTAAIVLFFTVVPVLAQRTIPMNLERLITDAGMIFSGRVVDVQTGTRDPQTNLIVTYVTFEVQENFYGTPSQRVTVKQYGGEADGLAFYPAGMPRYRVGEEVLMMMYGSSDIGMQSPVGMEQGKFTMKVDERSRTRMLQRAYGSQSLFKGLKHTDKVSRQSWLRDGETGPLNYDEFSSTIRALIPVLKK
jgi:hypothetical protein